MKVLLVRTGGGEDWCDCDWGYGGDFLFSSSFSDNFWCLVLMVAEGKGMGRWMRKKRWLGLGGWQLVWV